MLNTREKDIIEAMNLNAEMMENIKKYFQKKLSLNLDEDLIKLSLAVDSQDYPFFRAYARIYYRFCRAKMLEGLDNRSIFIDQEVINFYRLISNLAKEESDLNTSFVSKVILLNSPLAEESILKNNLEPVIYYDTIEFESEVYTLTDLIIQKSQGCKDIEVSYDRIKRATLSRKNEFDKIFHELLTLLLSYLPLYASGDISFKIICCYFEAIFMLLDESSRKAVYKIMDNSEVLKNPKYDTYGFLEEFVPSLEEKICKDLEPYNKRISLLNF